MAQPLLQSSFNSGEWAPNLWARTDIEKYRSGAALLRNFFVDYRGGASTRPGTKYCLRGYKDGSAIRLIPFQGSFNLGYICEFGAEYIRFYQNGAPVLETATSISSASAGPPEVFTDTAHGYSNNDWLFISNAYYIVQNATTNTFTLTDLFGAAISTNPFSLPTNAQRVYTITSPYAAADLALVKYAQNVDQLILCHPSYPPQVLTFFGATSWTIAAITFGTTISAPTSVSASSTLGSGSTFYSYVVTAIDNSGQESATSSPATLSNLANIAATAGTNTITWAGVSGAASYNVYKANSTQLNPVPTGVPYGYIGNFTSTTAADTNITPDFTTSPPVLQNPFISGSSVATVNITAGGSYTTAPTGTFSNAPAGGTNAAGTPVVSVISADLSIAAGGSGYVAGDLIYLNANVVVRVLTVSTGAVATYTLINAGSTSTIPSNPLTQQLTSGAGTGFELSCSAWAVTSINITQEGAGYLTAPTYTFSAGSAHGTPVLSPAGYNNPSVPAFFQQRLVLAASTAAPQTMFFSQPGRYFNFNTSQITQDDDAITASIISGQLNTIKSMVNQPAGLIVLTDGSSWLVNGGSFGSAVTPSALVANAQSFNGANDMPPIVVVYDMLYTQSKGSAVRDSLYNFYANVYTGNDVSILSSHLFFGYELTQWAWAEEPFKTVLATRNDGTMLTFTFLKEQDFAAWTHYDTDIGNGLGTSLGTFNSVATIIEQVETPASETVSINANYVVVGRTINGVSVQYIERFAERYFEGEAKNAWTVDCAIQYNGSPQTSFSGGEYLVGATCTGLADGVPIPAFVMPANGEFTLGTAASIVTIGLAFLPQLQTLYIDTGQPTVQSKQKKINAVTARVVDTLGLSVGMTFDTLVTMQDLVVGNVGSMTNAPVTDLVTGDARTYLDPMFTEQGQYCFQQSLPYPATILGVMPQLAVGDTASARPG